MDDYKYNILLQRLQQGDRFQGDPQWKTSALNKYIKQHGMYLKGDKVWCLGKFRGNVDPVMVLKQSDLQRVWKEVHDRPDGHAGREPTLHRFCTRYWFTGDKTFRRNIRNEVVKRGFGKKCKIVSIVTRRMPNLPTKDLPLYELIPLRMHLG